MYAYILNRCCRSTMTKICKKREQNNKLKKIKSQKSETREKIYKKLHKAIKHKKKYNDNSLCCT